MASPVFAAAYHGRCDECSEPIEIGDDVQIIENGRLVHEDCNPELFGDD